MLYIYIFRRKKHMAALSKITFFMDSTLDANYFKSIYLSINL